MASTLSGTTTDTGSHPAFGGERRGSAATHASCCCEGSPKLPYFPSSTQRQWDDQVTNDAENRQEIARLRRERAIVLDATGLGTWEVDARSGRVVLDERSITLLGYADQSYGEHFLFAELPHEDDRASALKLISFGDGDEEVVEAIIRFRCADGVYRCFSCRREIAEFDDQGTPVRAFGTLLDVDAEVKSRQLLQMEREVLDCVANGSNLYESLEALAVGIETVWDQVKCAINLHDPVRSTLHFGAAPSLPPVYVDTVEGFRIGALPTVCGLAIERREFTFIPDFTNAPKEFEVSLPFYHELKVLGCWSMPVFVGDEILATCCIFALVPRVPRESEIVQLERLAQTAGMLIESNRQAKQKADLETRVQTRDRLEGLGKLASGIAHDFNNLLTVILANAEIVALQDSTDAQECAEQIKGAGTVAADLCRKMLTYAGEVPFSLEAVDLGEIVNEIVSMIRSGSPKAIAIETDCEDDLPSVLGDHSMLAQLVLNLATNAVEAIEHGQGTVTISVDHARLDDKAIEDLMFSESVSPGEYVRLCVEDDGVGVDADTARRIFDPFFSTKPEGRGLGLATVFGVVRRHRGGISLSDDRPKGTAFTILLPTMEAKLDRDDGRTPDTVQEKANRTIAVVDDEATVRQSVSRLLGHHGFEVHSFASGEEALEQLTLLSSCDCVLLDLKMPGMDGFETYRRIRDQIDALPVCFMSGAASEPVESMTHGDARCHFIHKPFASDDLVGAIRGLLGETRSAVPRPKLLRKSKGVSSR